MRDARLQRADALGEAAGAARRFVSRQIVFLVPLRRCAGIRRRIKLGKERGLYLGKRARVFVLFGPLPELKFLSRLAFRDGGACGRGGIERGEPFLRGFELARPRRQGFLDGAEFTARRGDARAPRDW